MLPGFENITVNLKPKEKSFVERYMVPALKLKIGEKNGVTNKVMREKLFEYTGRKISDVKIRKYIQYIRTYNLVPKLVSTHKGYFVAKDNKEWFKWTESMRKRINEMSYTLDAAIYFNSGKETL